jgi:hypothetical protein
MLEVTASGEGRHYVTRSGGGWASGNRYQCRLACGSICDRNPTSCPKWESSVKSSAVIASLCVALGLFSVAGFLHWMAYVADRDAEALVWQLEPAPVPLPRIACDWEAVRACQRLGGEHGGWQHVEDSLLWTARWESRDGVPGVEFKEFPKGKIPNWLTPFGLQLKECAVSEENLRELAHLKNLLILDLAPSTITDAKLRILRETGMLHRTTMAQTGIWAPRVRPKSAAEVKYFNLAGTKVTDLGLKELLGFENLKILYAHQSNVTAAGLAELRKSLRNCETSQ